MRQKTNHRKGGLRRQTDLALIRETYAVETAQLTMSIGAPEPVAGTESAIDAGLERSLLRPFRTNVQAPSHANRVPGFAHAKHGLWREGVERTQFLCQQ